MELRRKRREKKIAEWDKAQNIRELKEDGELAELKRTNAWGTAELWKLTCRDNCMDKQGQRAALPRDRGLFLAARRKKSVREVVPS